MQLRWHADTPTLGELSLLDRDVADDEINEVAVRGYRLGRVREQMARQGIDGCLLFDPVNIRYATGSRNMQVFSARNPARYLFLPLSGRVILFEFTGCEHLADGLETIDEVRPAITASFVAAGPAIAERERLWARETAGVIREQCGAEAVIGIERVNAGAAMALSAEGFRIVDAQHPVELARAIKSAEELKCVRSSIRATERAVAQLRDAVAPGLTEQQLWSILHQGVIAQGGDYIETRLLSAGERTNPWFQEASEKVIGPNELVALDTDVVGCYGYYCDFSRTFHSGPDKPGAEQKALYRTSWEQVHHNMQIIQPGVTFREYSEKAWDIPERYIANRYYLSAHGVGMTGEYPYLYHRMDYPHAGYDGVIEPNMTICVESYIGDEGGREGVKLEQHCLVTETGIEVLSQFPFEDDLLDGVMAGTPDLRLVSNADEPGADNASTSTNNEQSADGERELPARPTGRTTWNTRAPVDSTLDPLSRDELVERIDLLLDGVDASNENLVHRCMDAAECGITSISLPPGRVREAATALQHAGYPPPTRYAGYRRRPGRPGYRHFLDVEAPGTATLHAVIRLPHDDRQSLTAPTRVLRQSVRDGARAIDLLIDSDTLRDGDQHALLVNLRRLAHETRDTRTWLTIVLDDSQMDERELVVAARLAARVRPDAIGDGPNGAGATARRVALIREAAGPRPRIRALLGPGGDDAKTLLDAGADRLGITGASRADTLIRSA